MSRRVDDNRVAELYLRGLSQQKVADIMGISIVTVRNSMRRSNLPARSLTEAHASGTPRLPLGPMEAEVLEGLMLGDGCLTIGANCRNAVLNVTRTARDIQYQQWIADVFATRLTPRGIAIRDVYDGRTEKTYTCAVLRTRADPVLTEVRSRWYPQGRKLVPSGLTLTPLTTAVWFADDGSIMSASRRCPDIKLATQGFVPSDVERLAADLRSRHGESVHVYAEKDGKEQRTIRLFGGTAQSFLMEIDPVFPPLARKSDKWRLSELLHQKEGVPPCPRCDSVKVYRHARSRVGSQQLKCQSCMRVFRDTYQRPGRDPRIKKEAQQ